jgi:hypothetical protein
METEKEIVDVIAFSSEFFDRFEDLNEDDNADT